MDGIPYYAIMEYMVFSASRPQSLIWQGFTKAAERAHRGVVKCRAYGMHRRSNPAGRPVRWGPEIQRSGLRTEDQFPSQPAGDAGHNQYKKMQQQIKGAGMTR